MDDPLKSGSEEGEPGGSVPDELVLQPHAPSDPGAAKKRRVQGSETSLEDFLARLETELGGGTFERCCEERLRALAYFLDSRRVMDHALAIVIEGWVSHPSRSPFELRRFIPSIDRAIAEILIEDESELPVDNPGSDHLEFMAGVGVTSERAHLACRRFNGLPSPIRKAFRLLALEGASLDDCIARGLGSEETLGRALYLCFEALLKDEPLRKVPKREQPNL